MSQSVHDLLSHSLHRSSAAALGVARPDAARSIRFFAHRDPNGTSVNLGALPPQTAKPAANPSEKPTVLPVASTGHHLPDRRYRRWRRGAAVGGPDNASVRYQFNIGDTARECDPAGPGQATLKIGVSGEVVIGPAGSAGTYNAPLRIMVTQVSDKTDVFSQVYQGRGHDRRRAGRRRSGS